MSLEQSLGQAIKNKRLEKGLSQKKLGDLCDPKIDASNIRRIENDTVSPTTETLVRIANALNVPVTDFFIADKEAFIKEATSDLEKFNNKMLVRDLFAYVCENNGFLVTDDEVAGWGKFFRVHADDAEYRVPHADVHVAFDNLVKHLSIDLQAFLEEYKIENGKQNEHENKK